MPFREYSASESINIPKAQEKIMDIMCEAWEQCLNRCGYVDDCPDRGGHEYMRPAMCMALRQSRLLMEAGYAPKKRGGWQISQSAYNDYKCSECGNVWSRTFDYCPSCGADMRGVRADDAEIH